MPLRYFCFMSWLILPVGLFAQEKELTSTDRPGFGVGTTIMEKSGFQMESGAGYSDIEEVRAFGIGELLFRYGLSHRVELRAALNSYVSLSGRGDGSGLEDSSISAKFGLLEGSDDLFRPALTLIAGVSLPTGDDLFGSDDPEVNAALSWGWNLAKNLSHSAYLLRDDGGELTFFSTSLGFALGDAGCSVGYGGSYPDRGENAHFLEANAAFTIDPRNQFDINGGVGLSATNSGYFIGLGFAHRF